MTADDLGDEPRDDPADEPRDDPAETDEDIYHCDHCDEAVTRSEAVRTKTFADLDPDTWQVLCCPTCGQRLETVFVGEK